MKRYYNIKEVIAHAMTLLPEADARTRVLMRTWVVMGLRESRFQFVNRKTAVIPYDQALSTFDLPDDFNKTIHMTVKDDDDNYIYPTRIVRSIEDDDQRRWTYQLLERKDDILMYGEDIDQELLNKNVSMHLDYFALPSYIDDLGNPDVLIDALMIAPLVSYLRYMFKSREQGHDDRLWNLWLNQLRQAKSRMKTPSIEEMQLIAREWMSMIPNLQRKKRNNVENETDPQREV